MRPDDNTEPPRCCSSRPPSFHSATGRRHQASTVRPDNRTKLPQCRHCDTRPPWCDRTTAPSFLRVPTARRLRVDAPTLGRMRTRRRCPALVLRLAIPPEKRTAARREELKAKIAVLLELFDSVYGDRQIHAEMARDGEPICPDLVRKRLESRIATTPGRARRRSASQHRRPGSRPHPGAR